MLAILIAIPMAILWNWNTQDSTADFHQSAHENSHDTITVVSQITPRPEIEVSDDPTPIQSQSSACFTYAAPAKPEELFIDVDAPMAEFISKLERASSALSLGITKEQLENFLYHLATSHSTASQGIINDAKLRYPDIKGIDVELDVARAYERSRAGKLYASYN